MAAGCILIIDVSSGKVRACVSLPDFDAANVGESLTAPDSPLLNRAFSAYAVGSVFKPVLAAAALEAGEGDFIRECPGYDALNGQVYRCAGSVPHGLVGLDGALEKSCNGYFIELGRELGPERVRQMAAALGFGKGQDIADGLRSASGVLPEAETLENEGQFANFCFGQGELLATPLQVAGMMNTIAAGGVYHTPLFVECTVDETTGEELTPLAHSSSRRVFSVQTAEKLQELQQEYTTKLEEIRQNTEELEELRKHLDEKLDGSDENVHKECVKVYRNVQAAVVEENEKQTEAIAGKIKESLNGKLNGVLGVSIAALLVAAADIVLHVLSVLHIF